MARQTTKAMKANLHPSNHCCMLHMRSWWMKLHRFALQFIDGSGWSLDKERPPSSPTSCKTYISYTHHGNYKDFNTFYTSQLCLTMPSITSWFLAPYLPITSLFEDVITNWVCSEKKNCKKSLIIQSCSNFWIVSNNGQATSPHMWALWIGHVITVAKLDLGYK